MPSPPSPPHSPPTSITRALSTPSAPRALLGQLEELRDNLGARVEQLSRAVERLRIQAGEIERALRENHQDFDRLTLGDVASAPGVTASVPSHTLPSTAMSARRLSETATGQRQSTVAANPTGSDETRPISQERLDQILESAVTGPAVYMPANHRPLNRPIALRDGYTIVPYIPSEGYASGTNSVRTAFTSTRVGSHIGAEGIQSRDMAIRAQSGFSLGGQDRHGLGGPRANNQTPYQVDGDAAMWTHDFEHFHDSQHRHLPARPAAAIQRHATGPVGQGAAGLVAPTSRRSGKPMHRAGPSRIGLKPTNLVESGKTKPIIVKSQPLSPSRTITPQDHVHDSAPPHPDRAVRDDGPSAASLRSAAPVPAARHGDGQETDLQFLARWYQNLPSSDLVRERRSDTGSATESESGSGAQADLGLTLRGQEVAAREAGAASPATRDIAYDMDDFERDYFLDSDNNPGAAMVAPGTGFAMPDTGSVFDLPQQLGQRTTFLPTGRTVAEVVDMIRRAEGQRMRALASDIVRHRPHTPSGLSREIASGDTARTSITAIGRFEDGTRTPRADRFGAVDPLAARFTPVIPAVRPQPTRQGSEADGQGPMLNAGPRGPNLNRVVESQSSSPAPTADLSVRDGTSDEMRARQERTLAAQVQVEITRDRVRAVARAAAAASEMGVQRLETLREFLRRVPESDYMNAIPSYIPGIDSPQNEADMPQSGFGVMERALGVADLGAGATLADGLRSATMDPSRAASAGRAPDEVDLADIGRTSPSGRAPTRTGHSPSGGAGAAEDAGAVLEGHGEASSDQAGRAARIGQATSASSTPPTDGMLRGSTAVSSQIDGDVKPDIDLLPMPIGRHTPRPYVSLSDL